MLKSECHLNRKKFSFAYRIADIWNGETIVHVTHGFENGIDKVLHDQGLIYKDLVSWKFLFSLLPCIHSE